MCSKAKKGFLYDHMNFMCEILESLLFLQLKLHWKLWETFSEAFPQTLYSRVANPFPAIASRESLHERPLAGCLSYLDLALFMVY